MLVVAVVVGNIRGRKKETHQQDLSAAADPPPPPLEAHLASPRGEAVLILARVKGRGHWHKVQSSRAPSHSFVYGVRASVSAEAAPTSLRRRRWSVFGDASRAQKVQGRGRGCAAVSPSGSGTLQLGSGCLRDADGCAVGTPWLALPPSSRPCLGGLTPLNSPSPTPAVAARRSFKWGEAPGTFVTTPRQRSRSNDQRRRVPLTN